MKNNMKVFPSLGFTLLFLFQITIGLLGFVVSGKMSQFSWLFNMLLLWLGVTVGMYVGGVPFLFQKSFTPKKSLVRFATTALGASVPVLFLLVLGSSLGIQNTIYLAIAPILAFLTVALSLLGFFAPGWFSSKTAIA